jgi:exo-1,4-beta-D-glucosaminidase
MTDSVDNNGHRLYKVNGQNILIRGAGYCPDLFLRSESDNDWQDKVMALTRDLNLNTIRFEGKHPSDHIYDKADEMGILMIPGWCCCDAWQNWGKWGTEQHTVAQESTRSQVKRLRIHASALSFWYSSDELPPATVENEFLAVFKAEKWPNTLLASASELTSSITGPTGVKMSGPYSWVAPNYWLTDPGQVGGAFGFLTEGGPGEAPLSLEMMSVTIPSSALWPINSQWNYHCGAASGNFNNLNHFTPPLNSRFGNATSAADYLRKAQASIYEGHRAMFEGYSRNKYTATGVVQWMLNNAWPGNIWHLFDSYLSPNPGSYFGSKKGCEPVHIQYSYDDNSIWVINSLYTATAATHAAITILNYTGASAYTHELDVASIGPDKGNKIFTLPATTTTTSYFLRLHLTDSSTGAVVSHNDYWLSKTQDVAQWSRSTWYNTPYSSYADYTQLQSLPNINVTGSATTTSANGQYTTTVTLRNPSTTGVALLVHARLLKKGVTPSDLSPADVTPLFWDDNYVTLFPSETRTLKATYSTSSAGGQEPDLVVEVFNNIK